MDKITSKVANPLTLIALFSGVSESIALAVLPFLAETGQALPAPLIWFSVLFPTLIVVLFFATLNFNHKVLYAPGDFGDEKHFLSTFDDGKHFVSILGGNYVKDEGKIDGLKLFWKPDGQNPNKENQKILYDWMTKNNLDVSSISALLYSRDKKYSDLRRKAIDDLGINVRQL
uniref:Uncharacterized protein n=1 Tax=Candidatus Kentrum sp. MB TaxID=2138164 RepID=A0A450X4M2_9GAMM|nr:MAG: hypothetical protein BECKMB1821G_GA0114241_100765 [Candidatus Kentron sp. MB]